MDTSSLGLLLWTQRCSGGITKGRALLVQCLKILALDIDNCIANTCVCMCVCCHTLQAGADVNLPNNIGDTPLHKAAFTGRKVPECVFHILSSSLLFLSLCWKYGFMHAFIRPFSQSNNQSINQSITYWSGGCHAAAALWCMCYCHQWDSTDSQRCHSKSRDQKHAGRWERHAVI